MTEPKKIKPADLRKWLNEVYTPWYEQVTAPTTQDDSGSNPPPPPPPPPGRG